MRCPAATRRSSGRQYSKGIFVSMVKVFTGVITPHWHENTFGINGLQADLCIDLLHKLDSAMLRPLGTRCGRLSPHQWPFITAICSKYLQRGYFIINYMFFMSKRAIQKALWCEISWISGFWLTRHQKEDLRVHAPCADTSFCFFFAPVAYCIFTVWLPPCEEKWGVQRGKIPSALGFQ